MNNRQLIRAFHGTIVQGRSGQVFRKFDKSKLGTASETSDSKIGFWFTTSKERAIEAASDAKEQADSDGVSAEVFEVSLHLTNPVIVPTIKDLTPAEVAVLHSRRNETDAMELSLQLASTAEPIILYLIQIISLVAKPKNPAAPKLPGHTFANSRTHGCGL